MKEFGTEWAGALCQSLRAELISGGGLGWRAFDTMLEETGFQRTLAACAPSKERLCTELLGACRDMMDRLGEEPAEGWLKAAYGLLTDGLYPPLADAKKPEPGTVRAVRFYGTALAAAMERERAERAFDPLTDVALLPETEWRESRMADEYAAFLRLVRETRYIELMRIGRECMPFDSLSHTAGVHHVAVHMARQARANGAGADVALVSAAALTHDIGKFGCCGDDAKRIPYLHYYFTDQWLTRNGLVQTAHIASNHSTWDLENENLPIESLLLIYADFRVRGAAGASGREAVSIHSLDEAGEIIRGKLADMGPEKRLRYSRVFHKLTDFERYLTGLSVNPDPLSEKPLPVNRTDPALLPDHAAVDAVCRLSMEYNIRLMRSVGESDSFERLLERARSEKTLESIRTYLNLFEEYFAYMTRAHKLQLLNFLYELLMHHESDVRRQAGRLMGRILANSGQRYRKELPSGAPETAMAPALTEMLRECAALWESFLDLLLFPDPKITRDHALRVVNSLKVVTGSLLTCCRPGEERLYLNPLLERFAPERGADPFVLCDSIVHVPAGLLTSEELAMLTAFAAPMLENGPVRRQVCALRMLLYLANERPDDVRALMPPLLARLPDGGDSASAYLKARLRERLDAADKTCALPALGEAGVSELYLTNLKTAVHWVVKVANIDRLTEHAAECRADAFHVATHLSNLLLVSEHLPVREHAGEALAGMAALLTVDQLNEIVIDLCRGLEAGQTEFQKYVPECLGALAARLPAQEREETVDALERMVRSSNRRAACAALSALGAVLTRSEDGEEAGQQKRSLRILCILLAGLAHFDESVHRAALSVLCREVFASERLTLMRRRALLLPMIKKLLTLLSEPRLEDVTRFNTAAMLNHLYRTIIDCRVQLGAFEFPAPPAAAFFPGTFDPFSTGHKRIVSEIRALNMEVYLAIDEFSWSKRTQPKLLRRQIAAMSEADQLGVYLFPDDIPVDLASTGDLAKLRACFAGRPLSIVVGNDVIENASAYRKTGEGTAGTFDHIVFRRGQSEDDAGTLQAMERLSGRVTELSLPTYYEDVSSSRIREYIDKNLEFSMLVDPIVEAFIRQKGLYLRTPQYKQVVDPAARTYTVITEPDESTSHVLKNLPAPFVNGLLDRLRRGNGCAVLMSENGGADASAAVYAHTINASQLFSELADVRHAEYARRHTSGRMLLLDGAFAPERAPGTMDELVNELLTSSLTSDHTYALYRKKEERDPLAAALGAKGFAPMPEGEDVLVCDMRFPLVIMLDAFMMLKEPFGSDPEVTKCVLDARKRLLESLCGLFPGELVLSFDTARINQALTRKVQQYNGVLGLPDQPRRLGPFMCVPYGKIMSDAVVPNTVTKTLHVEKVFAPDIRHFSIREDSGYSPLPGQIRTIHSFNRPVLLVDDLLHNGYRMEKLGPLFEREGVSISRILVGILSGRGKDLMDVQGRDVDAVYFVPNLRYWFNESLLYPFIGGDSVERRLPGSAVVPPAVNLILPYKSPDFIRGATDAAKRRLSGTALTNAFDILHTLERRYQALFKRSLTLARLGEALTRPRLPDRGNHMQYDRSAPASAYLMDDIETLRRIGGAEQ